MSETKKNLYLGLFILAAIATLAWLILFINPTTGDGGKLLHVRFSDISGISVKTRVCYAGNPVGGVTAIKKLKNVTEADDLGRLYVYELTLKVDSSVEVYDKDQISLNTSGLMGERSVGISPKAPIVGKTPKLITQETLFAKSNGQLENLIGQFTNLSQKLEHFVVDFQSWFSENSPALTHVVRSCSTNMNLIEDTLTQVKNQNMVEKTGRILDQVEKSTNSLNKLTQNIEQGKGTI
ncbi:MAG: MlaD family protein, partial [Chlamydiota bacterium]